MNRRDPEHERAHALFRRLVEEGAVCVIVEPLVRLEFWWAWQRAMDGLDRRALDRLTADARQILTGQLELPVDVGQRERSGADRRRHLLELGDRLLDLHLSYVNVSPLRLTKRLAAWARDVVVSSGLKSFDAVMVAAALLVGDRVKELPHVATLDNDFRRVDGLHVWGLSKRHGRG